MLFLEFGHIDGGQKTLAAIQQISQRQGGFGFANATGTNQQKHPDRRIAGIEAGGGSAHGAIQRSNGLRLATHAAAKVVSKTQHLAVVLASQLAQRYAGPVADHFGHQAWAHFKTDQAFLALGAS